MLDLGTGSLRIDPNVEDTHHHPSHRVRTGARPLEFDVCGTASLSAFTIDDVQIIFRSRCEHCRWAI
jgi:hypothetical protein